MTAGQYCGWCQKNVWYTELLDIRVPRLRELAPLGQDAGSLNLGLVVLPNSVVYWNSSAGPKRKLLTFHYILYLYPESIAVSNYPTMNVP